MLLMVPSFLMPCNSKNVQSSKKGSGVPSDILDKFCDNVCTPSPAPSAPPFVSSEPSAYPSVSQIPSRDPTCFICGDGNEITDPFGIINFTLADNSTVSVTCGALALVGKCHVRNDDIL